MVVTTGELLVHPAISAYRSSVVGKAREEGCCFSRELVVLVQVLDLSA